MKTPFDPVPPCLPVGFSLCSEQKGGFGGPPTHRLLSRPTSCSNRRTSLLLLQPAQHMPATGPLHPLCSPPWPSLQGHPRPHREASSHLCHSSAPSLFSHGSQQLISCLPTCLTINRAPSSVDAAGELALACVPSARPGRHSLCLISAGRPRGRTSARVCFGAGREPPPVAGCAQALGAPVTLRGVGAGP